LERRTARGGKDSIDHAPGAHDDLANCVAGSLLLAMAKSPGLWEQQALLVDGGPVRKPRCCDVVFAVLMAGHQGEAAVVYFALTVTGQAPLAIILDWGIAQLAPVLFKDVFATLAAFGKAVPPRFGERLFASRLLAEEMSRLGYPAFEVDDMATKDDELLSLAAATHIGLGRVKITADALASAEHNPLGGILDAAASNKEGDPLRTAVLVGIGLSFDIGRSLGLAA
jgi:hypothetical protein